MFTGQACITEVYTGNYPIGEKHAFILYLKTIQQSKYDWEKAIQTVENLGFDNVDITRAGMADSDKIRGSSNEEYYTDALSKGSAFVLYTDPVH